MRSEILDIRGIAAGEFAPLLEAESRAWQRDLRWDFAASARLISTCLEERRFCGYALRCADRIQGYCFFFLDGSKALIGDLFVEPADPGTGGAIALLEQTLHTLLHTPGIQRIEAQLPHFGFELLNASFRSQSFDAYRRQFMAADLKKPGLPPADSPRTQKVLSALQGEFRFESWERKNDREAAQLLWDTYRNHIDAVINDQYRTLDGASRLLDNVVYHRGCGEFLSRAAFIATHCPTGKLAGILGVTAVRRQTAHIPQIAVAAEFQRIGLGGALLQAGLLQLQKLGFEEVSLTVTSLNEGAIRLYERFGFRTFHSFGAFVWNRPC